MKTVLDWLLRNKEWFLSGIGISVPLTAVGWLRSRNNQPKLGNLSGSALNIGAGRDMHIGGSLIVQNEGYNESSKQIQRGQLAAFRDTIVSAAWEWESSMNRANELAESDPEVARSAMESSIDSIRKIVSAYRHNKHLFEVASRIRIDTLLEEAEESSDGLTILITAIQMIHFESERMASESS